MIKLFENKTVIGDNFFVLPKHNLNDFHKRLQDIVLLAKMCGYIVLTNNTYNRYKGNLRVNETIFFKDEKSIDKFCINFCYTNPERDFIELSINLMDDYAQRIIKESIKYERIMQGKYLYSTNSIDDILFVLDCAMDIVKKA